MKPWSLVRLCVPAAVFAAAFVSQAAEQTLYVATPSHIYVYSLGASEPRLTIADNLANVTQLAIDNTSSRYAANYGTPDLRPYAPFPVNYLDSSVTVYVLGQTTPFLNIKVDGLPGTYPESRFTGVAVDDFGIVFASALDRNAVEVYPPLWTVPAFEITSGIVNPGRLAVQGEHLYVQSGDSDIIRFPEGEKLSVTGLGQLSDFKIGSDGSVYATAFVVDYANTETEFVNVFKPNANQPSMGLNLYSGAPRASFMLPTLAVAGDSLYVSVPDLNAVFEYSISQNLKLVRTIDLYQPGRVAVDAQGNLYATASSELLVYPPAASTPSQVIALPTADTVVDIVLGK